MAIRFIPVSEINDPLTIALGISGGSGTGKTYTSLLVGRGIAEGVTGKKGSPIGYVDTENKRALHYKAAFPEMMHFDFTAINEDGELVGFGPERWIEVIDAAEAAELPVLIFDSFSHAWEGIGGEGSWAANPWIVAVSFDVSRGNIDQTPPTNSNAGGENVTRSAERANTSVDTGRPANGRPTSTGQGAAE